jgi:hypothetical protein
MRGRRLPGTPRVLFAGYRPQNAQNPKPPAPFCLRGVHAVLARFGVLAGVMNPEQSTLPNAYYRAKQ